MAQFLDSFRAGGIGKGGYELDSRTTSEVPLTLKLITGQVANALEIKNALGTTIFSVNPVGDVSYTGSETVTDALTVTGVTNLQSTLGVIGITTLTGALIANSSSTFNSAITVNAVANFNNVLEFDSNTAIAAGNHQIGRNSNAHLQYNVPLVQQHIFSVEDTAKMTISSTTFAVNNASVFAGTMTVNGALNVTGAVTMLGGLNLDELITWTAGEAVTAASYQIGRDADGTNQLHFNIPTGATIEFSINDVAKALITTDGVVVGGITHSTSGISYSTNDQVYVSSGQDNFVSSKHVLMGIDSNNDGTDANFYIIANNYEIGGASVTLLTLRTWKPYTCPADQYFRCSHGIDDNGCGSYWNYCCH